MRWNCPPGTGFLRVSGEETCLSLKAESQSAGRTSAISDFLSRQLQPLRHGPRPVCIWMENRKSRNKWGENEVNYPVCWELRSQSSYPAITLDTVGTLWIRTVTVGRLNCTGFVTVKNIQKSEKNPEVGGWIQPLLGFKFFFKFVFILYFCLVFFVIVHVSKKLDRRGGWLLSGQSEFFSDFLFFFNWQDPLVHSCTVLPLLIRSTRCDNLILVLINHQPLKHWNIVWKPRDQFFS